MQQFKRVFFSLIFTCDLIIKSLRVFRFSKKAKEAHYAIFFFRIEVDGAQWIQKNIHDIIHLLRGRVGFFLLKHSEFCLAWEIAATMLELQRIFTFALLSGSETSWLHEVWSKTYCIWGQGQSLETELGSEKPQHFSFHHRKVFVHWIAQKSLLKAITPLISAH